MKLSFNEWMRLVDRIIMGKVGVGANDLPDCNYLDWGEDGKTPSAAANKAIKMAGDY